MASMIPQILIVDDEPHLRSGLRRLLEKEGYKVATAPDGETALELAREKAPDLVLLDIMMPGIDGREVCRKLREITTTAQVVYLTAKAEPTGPLQLKQLRREANAFIAKPASSKQILSKVNSMLRSARQQPENRQVARTPQPACSRDCAADGH